MKQEQQDNPNEVVASIQIVLTRAGNVQARASVPNLQALLMMLETAKFDLVERIRHPKSDVLMPPPGLRVPRINGQ